MPVREKVSTDELQRLRDSGMTFPEIAAATGLRANTISARLRNVPPPALPRLSPSIMPQYNQPLTVEGDALILNDLEVPFHRYDFVNRCLDLCAAWKIDKLILGGDVLHFECLSAWGAAWKQEQPQRDVISEATESEWRRKIQALPVELQAPFLEDLQRLADNRGTDDDEIKAGAKQLKILAQLFGGIYYVLGNHDDRFLRKLQAPMTPDTLLNFLGLTAPCWHIAPAFYGVLTSGGEKWRIEHQRSAAPGCAVRLADKFECHVIVAHNHSQSVQWSTSGHYYAISTGCAADESRMSYAATRSTQRPAHMVGAAIIRGGIPFVLHERTPWEMYRRM